jgi:hypothetical protein
MRSEQVLARAQAGSQGSVYRSLDLTENSQLAFQRDYSGVAFQVDDVSQKATAYQAHPSSPA